jgi:hypothetical protein
MEGMGGQLHVPQLYPWQQSPLYPLDMRLSGSQGQSGHGDSLLGVKHWLSNHSLFITVPDLR